MSAHRSHGSISRPIIAGSTSVVLTTGLLVGWIYVILKNQELTQQWVGNLWLLVAGILSFCAIITVLILFSVFLARQILEVRRQTTFVDSVTHELRSPLASLRLCLETFGRSGLSQEQSERLRQMMLDDIERLSSFIDDILQASRLAHGGHAHAIVKVDLRPLLERCIAAVARRHKVEPESMVIEMEEPIDLVTDPTALEIIVKNLLDNAIKYSESPPRVVVTAKRMRAKKEPSHGDKIAIAVSDQGIGIPRHALKRVFERFYRVDDEATRARRGTGLGLHVVYALVRSLGGRATVTSDGPGRGTTMAVVFPYVSRGERVSFRNKEATP